MKSSKFFLSLFMLLMLFCVPGISSITVKAQGEFTTTEVTKTSITIDWSNIANEWLRDGAAQSPYFNSFPIAVSEYNRAKGTYNSPKKYKVSGKAFNYKITGLKEGTRYKIEVGLDMSYKNGGGRTWSIWDSIVTPGSKAYTINLLGRTDTSLYVDFTDALSSIESKVVSDGGKSYSFSYIDYSYAKQTGDVSSAITAARSNAYKKGARYNSKVTKKRITGLDSNSTYALSFIVSYSYTDKNNIYQRDVEYIEAGNFKTLPAGGYSDDIGDNSPGYQSNKKSDLTRYGFPVNTSSVSTGEYVRSKTTSDETSITIDWSSIKNTITESKDNKKITLGFVKEENYDAYKDYDMYGSLLNQGPYMRKAAQLAINEQIVVKKEANSYTFSGLKPGTQYCIVMKCGYYKKGAKPENSVRCDSCLAVYKVKTKGDTVSPSLDISKNSKPGYMFDCTTKREAGTVILDWTNARNAFLAQDICKKYFTRTATQGFVKVTCLPLPQSNDKDAIQRVYSALQSSNSNYKNEYIVTNVDLPATKARIFGLDMSKKYVFAISYSYTYFNSGLPGTSNIVFFADETGTNYLKKKATGTIDNGSGSGSGSGNGSDNGSGSGSTGNGGSDNASSENGSSNSNNNESNKQGTEPGNTSDKVITISGDSPDQSNIASAPKDKAKITVNKSNLKASKLKKKDQKVTIKIAGSKGKIKIKNTSSKKLRKYTKEKIRKNKITLTFKKGAPKGTYKFKISVGASGKIKKTSQVVEIVIK